MALDEPGASCVMAAYAPMVTSRGKKIPRMMTLSRRS